MADTIAKQPQALDLSDPINVDQQVSTEAVPPVDIPPSSDPTPKSIEELVGQTMITKESKVTSTESVPEVKVEVKTEVKNDTKSVSEPTKPTIGTEQEVKKTEFTISDLTANKVSSTDVDVEEKTEDIPADLRVNQILLGKLGDLEENLAKIYPTTESFDAAQKDPNSLFNRVMLAAAQGWPTSTRNHRSDVVDSGSLSGELKPQLDCGIPSIAGGAPKSARGHGQRVSGKEASMLLRARLGGLYRIPLLNSGFWVVIRAPYLDELQEIFNTIDIDGKELGRSLGAHFALVSDMFVKRQFIQSLLSRRIIIDSNFGDIYAKDNFIKALSFNDYDALIHGVLSMMTRRGLRMQMICPYCHKTSKEHKMDIASCKFVVRKLITDGMIEFLGRNRDGNGNRIILNENDLANYRKMLAVQKRTIKQYVELSDEKIRIELDIVVPSMKRYFDVGANLITRMEKTMNAISNGSEDKRELINASLNVHAYQLIAPWVAELRQYSGDNTEAELITSDIDTIIDYLDTTIQQNMNDDLIDELNKFIADTRINYFGTFSIECPHCHAKPDTGKENFYPFDVHTLFFGQCFRLFQAE